MRVLVTGAQGWLGRHVVAALMREPAAEVTGTGRSDACTTFTHCTTNGALAPMPQALQPNPQRYSYSACDILDADALATLVRRIRPSHVIHLAAALPGASRETLIFQNVTGIRTLANVLSQEAPDAWLLNGSSGAVYGTALHLPQDEAHPLKPQSPYGDSKREAEAALAQVARDTGLRCTSARIFNLIGAGTPPSLLPGSIAGQLARIICGRADPVIRIGPMSAQRDYVDVADCAAALVDLARLAPSDLPAINIASGYPVPVRDIWTGLYEISRARGMPEVQIARRDTVSDDHSVQAGSTAKMAQYGLTTLIPLATSLAELLEHALVSVAPHSKPT